MTAGAPAGDIAQARIDVETARDAAETAQRDLGSQRGAVTLAILNSSAGQFGCRRRGGDQDRGSQQGA